MAKSPVITAEHLDFDPPDWELTDEALEALAALLIASAMEKRRAEETTPAPIGLDRAS